MKKLNLLPLISMLAVPLALAGDKYGYYGKSGGLALVKVFVFLLAAFLFSVIFWWTYLWIVEDKGKLTGKKK